MRRFPCITACCSRQSFSRWEWSASWSRRNLIFILMSIEIMLNAAGLAFVVAGSHWAQADGQVMFIFILSVAAAEVSVGLALLLLLHRRFQTLDADAVSKMRG